MNCRFAEQPVRSQLKLSVLFLGAAAVSLVVDHREQHPQIQQGHGDEPHQNCAKGTGVIRLEMAGIT